MRRPYYNYWTYTHGDAMPEEIDPSMVTYFAPPKLNPIFTTTTPSSTMYANALQNFQQTPKKKRKCFQSMNGKLLIVFIVLFVLFLLAFVLTLIAWGVLSNGFQNVYSNEPNNGNRNQKLDADRRSRVVNCESEDCSQLADNIAKYLDPYANPCQSFYHYVCGRHSQESPVPDTNAKYGVHEILIKKLNLQLKNYLEKPTGDSSSKSNILTKQFYQKCMDLVSIQKEGLNPLKKLIEAYGGWPLLDDNTWSDKNYSWEITNAMLISELGVETLISVTVDPDPFNNSKMIITIDQPGSSDNNAFASFNRRQKRDIFHTAYLTGMVDLAVALGADRLRSANQLQDVVLFETLMMNITAPDEERQNHVDDYNLMSITDMKWEMPTIDWNLWVSTLLPDEIKIKNEDKIFNVVGLDFLNALEDLLGETSSQTLANYHIFNLVESYVDFLSPVYSKYKQKHTRFVYGIESNLERWEDCVLTTANHLAWPLSAMYVKNREESNLKDDVEVLVSNLQRTMERKLRQNEWMDDATTDKALDKLAEMDHRIAYPGFIYNDSKIMEEYKQVDISDKSYFESVVNLTGQQIKRSFMRFIHGEYFVNWPYDSPPISVNAFYRFQDNEIVLPIGLLQMPLISSDFPKYVQYSRIGVLAGHEMTHAYDVEGSQYDKSGNLHVWWTNETLKKFQSRTDCLVKQYDNITEPITGKQLHGKRMIGESLSDNSALSLAYDAYKIWLKDNGVKEEKHLRGLSEYSTTQMFFLSFANMWCETVRPEAVQFLLDTEEHALSSYRVDVPLQNFDEFSKNFNCPPGSPMNPPKKCHVW